MTDCTAAIGRRVEEIEAVVRSAPDPSSPVRDRTQFRSRRPRVNITLGSGYGLTSAPAARILANPLKKTDPAQ
jgi:hypothetical protein